jgi:hypothetical protein
MRQDSFTWNDATITVREPLGMDALLEDVIKYQLGSKLWQGEMQTMPTTLFLTIQFAQRVFCQSTVSGDIGFDLPLPTANEDGLLAGYQALMAAPRDLIMLWKSKLEGISKDPVETEVRATTAPELPTAGKKSEALLKPDSGGGLKKRNLRGKTSLSA